MEYWDVYLFVVNTAFWLENVVAIRVFDLMGMVNRCKFPKREQYPDYTIEQQRRSLLGENFGCLLSEKCYGKSNVLTQGTV